MPVMENYFSVLPPPEELMIHASDKNDRIPGINGHIHSPYSFSAFSSIEQACQLAKEEGISVLGINDFNTTSGFAEFASLAIKYRIFPLFNIEFMALQTEEQQAGLRVNDPVNPGRTYLSGKGLSYPVAMNDENTKRLEILQEESNRQTYRMVEKLNEYLSSIHIDLSFDAVQMQRKLAKGILRERHIATAIRLAMHEKYKNKGEILDCMTLIFGDKVPKSSIDNISALENEIRNNLLKSGGPAFVPEDEKAFLSLETVINMIIDAGGIPCYPVLLDDQYGNFTDFENGWEKMADRLIEKGIHMIELIPGRNNLSVLKKFVLYFRSRGFCISFGSEHNTPKLDPLTITCRGKVPLDDDLNEINYSGVSVIAAHQYLKAYGKDGFPSEHFPSAPEIQKLEQLGKTVISEFTKG